MWTRVVGDGRREEGLSMRCTPRRRAVAAGGPRRAGAWEQVFRRSEATTEGLAATEEQRKGNLPLVPWGCRGDSRGIAPHRTTEKASRIPKD